MQTAVEVGFDLGEGDGARLDPELEATIYRLVQEAVNNAIKHASAKSITITLTESEGSIAVVVRDDGSGFDPDAVEPSFGLIGMQERVALARGALEIDSTPGAGTIVRAELPLARAEAADLAKRAGERSASESG